MRCNMPRTLYVAVVSGGEYDDSFETRHCASFDLAAIEKWLADKEASDIIKDTIALKIHDFYVQWHEDNDNYKSYAAQPSKPKTKGGRGGNGFKQLTPEENKIHLTNIEAWKIECEKVRAINEALSAESYNNWIAALKEFYDENGWEHPVDGEYGCGRGYIDEKTYSYETIEYLED